MQPHPQNIEREAVAQETIVAISTPPGRGGIGIVRLSGRHAAQIAERLVRTRAPLEHARARLADIPDPDASHATGGRRLDEAMVTLFLAPRSYTGEDLVEIAAHGSPVILEMLVRQALRAGARLARPGEFTERAFLAGRIDLTQAEAVRDLIEAQTLYQARIAAEQMGGALSRRVHPLKEKLVELVALLEAGIDFAEDDVELTPDAEIVARIVTIAAGLQPLAQSFEHGRMVHSGVRLAIVGRPNVGKSSLFNRLLERERAIVTAEPGTTRDVVSERLSLGGIPVELMDTAGLREARGQAEALGIRKSREALADADLVLVVLDASIPLSAEEEHLIASLRGRRALVVSNKCDLCLDESGASPGPIGEVRESGAAADEAIACEPDESRGESGDDSVAESVERAGRAGETPSAAPAAAIAEPLFSPMRTSAMTGAGIEELRQALAELLRNPAGEDHAGMLTSLRHFDAVSGALEGLEAAQRAVQDRVPHEMLLLDLYSALRHLDGLTGETTPDDILARIFSSFCIGK